MTVPSFTTEAAVREILDLNAAGSSRYSAATIASNIRTSAYFLERSTGRIFRDETSLTLKFTTNNAGIVYLPGLRTASSVTLNGSAFVADESYWLTPDSQQTGVYTAITFHPYGTGDYRSYPDWFDRNLDSPYWRGLIQSRRSLPNDLVIAGAWGYPEATLPEPVRDANTRHAAWLTLRSDALLSGARATDAGIFDLSNLPIEVQNFVSSWKSGPQAVGL